MFKSKSEKIYKFVYVSGSGYHSDKKTTLLTACNPVQAVKKFNRMAGDKMYNIIEFINVIPKTEESK